MRKLQALLMGVAIVIATPCCKDDPKPCADPANPDCPNYDPCFGQEKKSADFIIEDGMGFLPSDDKAYFEEDSIFKGVNIRFTAKDQGSGINHIWYLGAEKITDSQFVRDFLDVPRPMVIEVSHVIEYTPNFDCFPTETGRDSISKTFNLIEYWDDLATYGTFRVFNENIQDSMDFMINQVLYDGTPAPFDPNITGIESRFINLHGNGDTTTQLYAYFPVNSFAYIYDSSFDLYGWLELNNKNQTIKIVLDQGNNPDVRRGRKIN